MNTLSLVGICIVMFLLATGLYLTVQVARSPLPLEPDNINGDKLAATVIIQSFSILVLLVVILISEIE